MAIDLESPSNFLTTRLRQAVNWGRKYSLWPLPFGVACCAIEFMSTVSSYNDISRFGAELVRFSPPGTISYKQAPILKTIYEQMADPKWVIAMGACASSGGFYNNYSTLQGADRIIPVDVYVAGCPPTPENLMFALTQIQEKVEKEGLVPASVRHADKAQT